MFSFIFSRAPPPPDVNNVVLFGETGAGKSSIINMLVGRQVARTSSSLLGCTFRSERYSIEINNLPITIWDTAGLNEGDQGIVPRPEAIVALYRLLRNLSDGISLLMFVMRAHRIRESVTYNWKFFRDVVCREQVPCVIVITGLETEVMNPGDRMSNWWRENDGSFRRYGIIPSGYACITTIRGRQVGRGPNHVYDDLYDESRNDVRELIRTKLSSTPFCVPPAQWFSTVVDRSVEFRTRWCRKAKAVVVERERIIVMEATLRILRAEYGMEEDEATDLAQRMSRYR